MEGFTSGIICPATIRCPFEPAIGLGLVSAAVASRSTIQRRRGSTTAPAIFVQLSLAADGGALRRVRGVAFGVGLPARRKMPGPLV